MPALKQDKASTADERREAVERIRSAVESATEFDALKTALLSLCDVVQEEMGDYSFPRDRDLKPTP